MRRGLQLSLLFFMALRVASNATDPDLVVPSSVTGEKIWVWSDPQSHLVISFVAPPKLTMDNSWDGTHVVLPIDHPFDFSNYGYYIRSGRIGRVKRTVVIPRTELERMQDQLNAAVEREEFLEDCLAEVIQEVYKNKPNEAPPLNRN